MTDKKKIDRTKTSHTLEIWDTSWERILNIMDKDKRPKNELSEVINELLLDRLNKKCTQDYSQHWVWAINKTECFKCHETIDVADYALHTEGITVCQKCVAKKWSPTLERRRSAKLELETEVNCLKMEETSVGLKLDEKRKELGYADDSRSMQQIHEAKQAELEAVIYELNVGKELKASLPELQEKKERLEKEVKDLKTKVGILKLDIEWEELWKVLNAMFGTRAGSKEEKELIEKLKEERLKYENLRDDIIADVNGPVDQPIEKNDLEFREARQGQTPST